MNLKRERKARTHTTILDSAARLLRERGIVGARVADVMSAAGLTVGGFYAHFASKEALVDAALRRTSAEMRAKLFASLDEKPAESRAEIVVKRYLSAAHRDEERLGCPLPAVAGEVSTIAPEHAPVIAEQIDDFAGELEAHLDGERAGKRNVALGLVALMVGALTLARATRGTVLSDEVLRAARAVAANVLDRRGEQRKKERT
jgi:TetR/AcrR family transcriptional regulator, transcriptional repressor for nem operon